MIRSRRGVTLIELMIAMVIAAILGAATLGMMMSQSRLAERTEGQRSGRRVSRSAINVITNDLRMVDPSWGVEAASSNSITVKVPYALGLVCSYSTTIIKLAILPVDSVVLATAGYSGFATRGSTGVYTPNTIGTLAETPADSVTCVASPANITPISIPSGLTNQRMRWYRLTTTVGAPFTAIAVGTPVMLYRRTSFYFGNSNQTGLSGRTALWRNYLDGGGGAVELAAPFDSSAAFRFYETTSTTSQTTVPVALTDIYGFELYLPGQSEKTSRIRNAPEQANLTTSVFLVNRAN